MRTWCSNLLGTPGQRRFWFVWDDLVRGAIGAFIRSGSNANTSVTRNVVQSPWPSKWNTELAGALGGSGRDHYFKPPGLAPREPRTPTRHAETRDLSVTSWSQASRRDQAVGRTQRQQGRDDVGGRVMGARPIGGTRARTLRYDVIRMYERRLPKARVDDARAGIWHRDHMHRQLERLRAGLPVQLHRWGELDRLPKALRPADAFHSLFELRGDQLVPVPTQQRGLLHRLGDSFLHAAWLAGVVMIASNSIGVNRPRAA
jgi:hypothetical protein